MGFYPARVKQRTISVTKAARDLPKLADRVRKSGNPVIITKYGHPVARLVPIEPPPVIGTQLAKRLKQKKRRFVVKSFSLGEPLIDLTHVNRVLDQMEIDDYLAKERRLREQMARTKK
jgi:prevent-host-death family protein